MLKHKKIALLNLQVDGNYGGHLQRYALITVLQRMGYDVTHLNTRFPSSKKTPIKRIKGCLKRLFLYPYYAFVKKTNILFKYYLNNDSATEVFYDKYIPHTDRIYSKEELTKYINYDCFVVGSDQVWRKSIASEYGLFTYMFDYLPKDKKRVAYGASLGTNENELTVDEIEKLKKYYSQFNAVSTREISGLDLLASYGCNNPKPERVIDPTLLLTKDDYELVIQNGRTTPLKEKIFCYILDMNEQKVTTIQAKAREKEMDYRIWDKDNNYTVEQWLRSFRDAEFVVTDSFHGLVFSLIFNKPFCLLRNEFRGNARFDSLAEQFGVELEKEQQNYEKINKAIVMAREQSIRFLKSNIC